jgi:hypothetical protein
MSAEIRCIGVGLATTLIAIASLLLPATAAAQARASPSFAGTVSQATRTASEPRGDVFAGVAFWNEDDETLTGFHLAGAFRTGRHFALVGDLALYEQDTTTIMGGVRVYGPAQKVSIFGQFLVGNAPLDDIAFQPGVGVDVQVGRNVALRAAFDVKISGDDGSTYIGTRFSTGVVIQLGRK